jgi:hypothetical protein
VKYRSQATFAHRYVLATSSSAFRLLHLFRDWASREEASSMSSGGRVPGCRGMRLLSACSIGLLISNLISLLCSKRVTSERYLSAIVIETSSMSCASRVIKCGRWNSGGWSSKFEPLPWPTMPAVLTSATPKLCMSVVHFSALGLEVNKTKQLPSDILHIYL